MRESQAISSSLQRAPSAYANLDSVEIWGRHERTLFSALKTGDDRAAHSCLEHLTARFGAGNERILSLKGLYQEAVAKDDTALQKVLQSYDRQLSENPSNLVRCTP